MSDELTRDNIFALSALQVGTEFALVNGGEAMAAFLPGGEWVAVTNDDLAALHRRALIEFSEDDPEIGMPRRIDVTRVGRDFLKRWQAANGVRITRTLKVPNGEAEK